MQNPHEIMKVHNVCLNQDVSEYLPKTSLFPKKMHETTLKTVKKRSVKLAKMPWHQEVFLGVERQFVTCFWRLTPE